MSRTDFWTEQRVELLRELLAEGASASMAAAEIGCSRNAVIGVAARRKIAFVAAVDRPARVQPARAPKRAPLAVMAASVSPGEGEQAREGGKAAAGIEPPFDRDLWRVPQGPVKRQAFLLARDCRFPFGDVGDEDFGFCGAEQRAGSVYCAGHHRLCYTPRAPARALERRAA